MSPDIHVYVVTSVESPQASYLLPERVQQWVPSKAGSPGEECSHSAGWASCHQAAGPLPSAWTLLFRSQSVHTGQEAVDKARRKLDRSTWQGPGLGIAEYGSKLPAQNGLSSIEKQQDSTRVITPRGGNQAFVGVGRVGPPCRKEPAPLAGQASVAGRAAWRHQGLWCGAGGDLFQLGDSVTLCPAVPRSRGHTANLPAA